MRSHVYFLHNGDFEPRYIGQTAYPERRLREHRREARNGVHRPVYHWMNKYGPENIQMFLLAEADTREQINELEIFFIAQERAGGRLLNVSGGGGGGMLGTKLSEETRAKMSEAHSGEKNHFYQKSHTPEARALMSKRRIGTKLSKETRRKLSEVQMGRPSNSGQHARWHRDRGIIKPDCTYCTEVTLGV